MPEATITGNRASLRDGVGAGEKRGKERRAHLETMPEECGVNLPAGLKIP
jgi:hypothetical protein